MEATIMEIQGQGAASPLAGELVRTTGVVTLETASAGSFWMQDSQGDGDPSTSDGIYVYQGNYITEVKAGDLVEVTAFVKEYTASGAPASLPLTELVSARKIEVLASGEPPPAPVPLEALPDFCVPEAIAFWEALEGMLVSVDHGVVVAPTSSRQPSRTFLQPLLSRNSLYAREFSTFSSNGECVSSNMTLEK